MKTKIIPTKNSFSPVEIKITFETRKELLTFLAVTCMLNKAENISITDEDYSFDEVNEKATPEQLSKAVDKLLSNEQWCKLYELTK